MLGEHRAYRRRSGDKRVVVVVDKLMTDNRIEDAAKTSQ
jgi:hypothetical protein